MTCMSCVRSIEGSVRELPGIAYVKVELSENAGYFRYEPRTITEEAIRSHIEDMGFEVPNDTTEHETRSVSVRLSEGTARIRYVRGTTTARQLADTVYALGFSVTVLAVDGDQYTGQFYTILSPSSPPPISNTPILTKAVTYYTKFNLPPPTPPISPISKKTGKALH
ncbi:hypothetical protein HF086_014766 [Spodoptera exigua]|uniref:HMA domain-containing protein n=1 Tax=Spodoptera exigua TaxID=7107 RepID=A0A922MIK9_SPOEX|nr:hypothetical protein HF086_014766 [Spodoptera exigua]